MTVGVSSLYSTYYATHVYKDVITGVGAEEIENESVVFKVTSGVLAAVDNGISGAPTDWDLRVWNYAEDMAEPQHYMLDRNAVLLRYALTYDCNVFDKDGVCVGASASFGQIQGEYGVDGDSSALLGTLVAAKRFGSNVRVGMFTQFGSVEDDIESIDVTFRLPLLGAFIGYSDLPDGSGLQARASVAYEQGKADFSRIGLLGSANDVTKGSDFETMGVYGEIGWGFALTNGMVLTPYLNVIASEATRQGYDEPGSLGFSYDDYSVSQVTGGAGLRLQGMFSPEVSYRLGAGVEHDFSYDVDAFEISGDFGSTSYTSDQAPSDWRLNGTAGLSYLMEKNRELTLDGFISQFADDDAPNYAVSAGFKFGF